MIKEDFLEILDVEIEVIAPTFIGSGKRFEPIDYIYTNRMKTVFPKGTDAIYLIDFDKLTEIITRKKLEDKFEKYVFDTSEKDKSLYTFMEDNLTQPEIKSVISRSISTSDTKDLLNPKGRKNSAKTRQIHSFVRNGNGEAYLPGSSLKGALRTAILTKVLLEGEGNYPYSDKNGKYTNKSPEAIMDETPFLSKLDFKDKDGKLSNKMVRDIMRGISVLDSEMIPDSDMILCAKYDYLPDMSEFNTLPILRECVRPGTKIKTRIVLDQSLMKRKITREFILDAINKFFQFYKDWYIVDSTEYEKLENIKNGIYLGGGSGFLSKTVIYPYQKQKGPYNTEDFTEGVYETSKIMHRQFKNHGHEYDDEDYGISPHMLKYTCYQSTILPFGLCSLKID